MNELITYWVLATVLFMISLCLIPFVAKQIKKSWELRDLMIEELKRRQGGEGV